MRRERFYVVHVVGDTSVWCAFREPDTWPVWGYEADFGVVGGGVDGDGFEATHWEAVEVDDGVALEVTVFCESEGTVFTWQGDGLGIAGC